MQGLEWINFRKTGHCCQVFFGACGGGVLGWGCEGVGVQVWRENTISYGCLEISILNREIMIKTLCFRNPDLIKSSKTLWKPLNITTE